MLFIKQSFVPSTVYEIILQAPGIPACLKYGAGPRFLCGKYLTDARSTHILQIADVYSVHN